MMSKRFKSVIDEDTMSIMPYLVSDMEEEAFYNLEGCVDLLNEQQELIEELHISDHMGWERAEKFEKELKQKKIYIKRLEYKVQKFKEMNSEQQDTINKLRKILAEAEDTIEIRLPEHYIKEYENIKHNIIGD